MEKEKKAWAETMARLKEQREWTEEVRVQVSKKLKTNRSTLG